MKKQCIDCKGTSQLKEFKQDGTIVYICKRCLDAKVDKGIKNHNRFVSRSKNSQTYKHIGQV